MFPATEERAVRVDMFDVEIESLRWFSTFTQRSLGEAEAVEIAPAAELAPEHRELAEIAALEDADERPDVAELLPVERFQAVLDLAPEEARVLVAAEEDVDPALDDLLPPRVEPELARDEHESAGDDRLVVRGSLERRRSLLRAYDLLAHGSPPSGVRHA